MQNTVAILILRFGTLKNELASESKQCYKWQKWTHWELNPTPLADKMLSERDNQPHHVPDKGRLAPGQ